MAPTEDARTSMTYMQHLREIALAGVALIVEKTRTYGPSWKRRGGRGAWFTMVRPWDRLEAILERHDGDLFDAISTGSDGADGSALACLRDLRNYTLLAEAEMVARGVVAVPANKTEYHATRVLGPEELGVRWNDVSIATRDYVDQDRPRVSDLGAGPVVDGRYTILDLGHGDGLWHAGIGAVPADSAVQLHRMLDSTMSDHLEHLQCCGWLVASRRLEGGDHQIIVRIPG